MATLIEARRSRRRSWRAAGAPWLLGGQGLLLLVVAAVVVWPLLELVREALVDGPAAFGRVFVAETTRAALLNTLGSSLVATLLALLVGGGMAIMLDQFYLPGERWLRLGMILPLLIPPFVVALGWAQAYGPAGLLKRLVGAELVGLFGGPGVTILLAAHGAPLAFLTVSAALAARGARDLERAARASGANALTTLGTVTLPLLQPAFGAAAGLVYISSASDFGIPAVLGIPGRFPTVTTEIYRSLSFSASQNSFAQAVALATLLVALALALLLLVARLNRGTPITAGGGLGQPPRRLGIGGTLALLVGCAYVAIVALGPLLALVLVALTRAYGLDPLPANWSPVNFAAAVQGKAGLAFGRSILLAAVAASLVAAVGVATATLARRYRWGSLLEATVALPYAVPGSAVAISMILAFSRWWYGTLAIIVVAYLARFWALGERPIGGALAQLGPDPFRAARACGAGPLRAWLTGVWPGIRPAVFAGWMLVFLTAMHELTVSSLLYVPGTETIAVVVLSAELAGDVATTAAIAVLLTAIILVPAVVVTGSGRLGRLVGLG